MQRRTQQRAAIVEAIREAGRPLAPREIHELARRKIPEIGIATVYRAIKDLLSDQKLTAVEVPGAPPRYEVAGLTHHHHFLCRSCDRMMDILGCPGDLAAYAPPGFTVESHELTLVGLCLDCSSPRRSRRNRSRKLSR
ncbi:MAG: transcriptional repressor [Kiritimatiellae bacterium]|nr:transcriptional repressor [Kiritimatiellia bacterium]MDW8458425.1 transcriptional repressor [Verrucomicrobiota bacterium]